MQQLIIKTAAGEMPVDLFSSRSDAPLIVLLMDAIGIRQELRDVAASLADLGYRLALPNLYYREGHYEDMDFNEPAVQQNVMRLYSSLSHQMVRDDISELLSQMFSNQPVGMLGYCMGGANALVLAGAFPNVVKAAAAIHPGGFVTDAQDSPHRMVVQAQGEIYIAIADRDPYATAEQAAVLEQALLQGGVSHQLDVYAGAAHGFSFESLPTYNADAQARYWQASTELFQRCLQ